MNQAQRRYYQHMRTLKRMPIQRNGSGGILLPGLMVSRILAGISQVSLAKKAGVGHTTVEKLETQRRGAYASTIKKLSIALDVEPVDLMCPKTIFPVHEGDEREAVSWMKAWGVDRNEYRVGPALTFLQLDEVARDLKAEGVSYWTIDPPMSPEDPFGRIPIRDLEGQGRR